MKNMEKKQEDENLKRREAIITIVKECNIRKQEEVVHELVNRGFPEVQQSTISKDFKKLNIKKYDGTFYSISEEILEEMLIEDIKELLMEEQPVYYKNVALHYMKIEKGSALKVLFHFRQAFPNAILEGTIQGNSLLLLLDMSHEESDILIDLLTNNK